MSATRGLADFYWHQYRFQFHPRTDVGIFSCSGPTPVVFLKNTANLFAKHKIQNNTFQQGNVEVQALVFLTYYLIGLRCEVMILRLMHSCHWPACYEDRISDYACVLLYQNLHVYTLARQCIGPGMLNVLKAFGVLQGGFIHLV